MSCALPIREKMDLHHSPCQEQQVHVGRNPKENLSEMKKKSLYAATLPPGHRYIHKNITLYVWKLSMARQQSELQC